MSEPAPIIHVALGIFGGDIDPDDVTRHMGIEPTRVWRRGDAIMPGKQSALRQQHAWWFSLGESPSFSLDERIRTLLERLAPAQDAIKHLLRRGVQGEISCVIQTADATPSMHLDPELLRQICELGLSLDIDLYVRAQS